MKCTIIAFVAVLMMGSVAMADGRGRSGGHSGWNGYSGGSHGGWNRHSGGGHSGWNGNHGSNWGVSIGFGWGSPSYERYPRVYYPPVYYSPPVVYVPAPVYCPPPPVYYSPPVYCPPPTVYYPPVYRPAYDHNYSRVEFYYRR